MSFRRLLIILWNLYNYFISIKRVDNSYRYIPTLHKQISYEIFIIKLLYTENVL